MLSAKKSDKLRLSLALAAGRLTRRSVGAEAEGCQAATLNGLSYQAASGAGSVVPQPKGGLPDIAMWGATGNLKQAADINKKLDAAYFWEEDDVATECVNTLSEKDLAALPYDTRVRLWKAIDAGYVGDVQKSALDKLDRSVPTIYGKRISIKGNLPFRVSTIETLDKLNALETGKAILADRGSSDRMVTIEQTADLNGYATPLSTGAFLTPEGKPGGGSDSIVHFNPEFGPSEGIPNELVLGHELIHASHCAKGIIPTTLDKNGTYINEEHQTVGLPPYSEIGLTENSLRVDLGLSKRTKY